MSISIQLFSHSTCSVKHKKYKLHSCWPLSRTRDIDESNIPCLWATQRWRSKQGPFLYKSASEIPGFFICKCVLISSTVCVIKSTYSACGCSNWACHFLNQKTLTFSRSHWTRLMLFLVSSWTMSLNPHSSCDSWKSLALTETVGILVGLPAEEKATNTVKIFGNQKYNKIHIAVMSYSYFYSWK